jgi:hypothetical protein
MPFDLLYLIRASGFSGVSGQSFVNNVLPLGAKSGTKMSDYKLTAWSFAGEPVPETTYEEGDAFALTVDFVQGLMAEYIKLTGAGRIVITPQLSPAGFDVYNTASSVVGPASGSSASLNVHAPYGGSISYDGTAWFSGYIPPDKPAGAGGESVAFQGIVISSGASGTDACSFRLSYVPDVGPFNPTLTHDFPLTMARRNYSTDASQYLWEWYSDDTYSTLVHTGDSFTVTSFPGDSFTYYLRARKTAGDPWTNVGAVTFVDPRNEV